MFQEIENLGMVEEIEACKEENNVEQVNVQGDHLTMCAMWNRVVK